MDAEDVGHSGGAPDHCHRSLVEVLERRWRRLAVHFAQDAFRRVGPTLHRHLCESRQWISLSIRGSRQIADYIDIRIVRNRKVGLYFDSASPVGLRVGSGREKLSERRGRYTACPNHGFCGNAIDLFIDLDVEAVSIDVLDQRPALWARSSVKGMS